MRAAPCLAHHVDDLTLQGFALDSPWRRPQQLTEPHEKLLGDSATHAEARMCVTKREPAGRGVTAQLLGGGAYSGGQLVER